MEQTRAPSSNLPKLTLHEYSLQIQEQHYFRDWDPLCFEFTQSIVGMGDATFGHNISRNYSIFLKKKSFMPTINAVFTHYQNLMPNQSSLNEYFNHGSNIKKPQNRNYHRKGKHGTSNEQIKLNHLLFKKVLDFFPM